MDAPKIAAIVSMVVAVISLVVVVVQTAAANNSAAAAEDSVSAAERQALEAELSADAAEQQVAIMREHLAQSRAEWAEQRTETIRGVVRLLIDAAETWHESAELLVSYVVQTGGVGRNDADLNGLLERHLRAIRSATSAIASTLPYAVELPFCPRIVRLSQQVGRSSPVITLARHPTPPAPNDPDLVAAAQFLASAVQVIDGLHESSARWLLGGSTGTP